MTSEQSPSDRAFLPDEHKSKEYLLRRNDGSYKRITSKCILRARDHMTINKCQSDPGGSRATTPLSATANRSSQTRSFRHHSPSCSSNAATTTRKCVLTLDGYNYVIGKLHYNQTKFVQLNVAQLSKQIDQISHMN